MATLQNRIELSDGVSPVLKKILQATDNVTKKMSSASNAIGNMDNSMTSITNKMERLVYTFSDIGSRAGSALSGALNSTIGQFTIAGLATNAITGITSMVQGALSGMTRLADGYASVQARLNILTGSQAKVSEMNDLIYASALRARGSFETMADAVTKIGLTAKEAFPDPSEVVPFVENVQKLFAVGGTDAVQASSAMLQLTQALGSGKLQGDEFRSIAEAAPMIEQMVAKTMGVTQGQLKALSSEGAITADIIKQAMLENTDEINAMFEKMPMTFSQAIQNLETVAYKAFTPVFEQMEKLANSPAFNAFMQTATTVLFAVGSALASTIQGFYSLTEVVAGTAQSIWNAIFGASTSLTDVLIPALGFVIGAVGTYALIWGLANASLIAHNVIATVTSVIDTVCAVATSIWTVATNALAIAQMFLGSQIAIVVGIIAFIPLLIAVVVGAFLAWSLATYGIRDTFISVFETLGAIVDAFVNNAIAAINKFIDVLNIVAKGINNVFGGNIQMTEHVGVGYTSNKSFEWGRGAANWYDDKANAIDEMFNPSIPNAGTYAGWNASGSMGVGEALDSPAGKQTADNTGKMADSLDILEEEIKYMKDFAEQEAMLNYTRQEFSLGDINTTVNNTNGYDIDGVIAHIEGSLYEQLNSSAEAVHA